VLLASVCHCLAAPRNLGTRMVAARAAKQWHTAPCYLGWNHAVLRQRCALARYCWRPPPSFAGTYKPTFLNQALAATRHAQGGPKKDRNKPQLENVGESLPAACGSSRRNHALCTNNRLPTANKPG